MRTFAPKTSQPEALAPPSPARPRPETSAPEPAARSILRWQRTLGNRAVRRRLRLDSREPRLQREPQPDPQPSPGVQFPYSVKVSRILDADQLLLAFIKQYRGVASDAEAAALRDKEHWQWTGEAPVVKQANVDKGFILITVTDRSITPATADEKKQRGEYFKGLAPGEQAAINAETDRELWEKTQYRAGQKLGTSADDKRMAEYWKVLREELIRKRQAIEALPPDIQAFLFDEQAPALAPADFAQVLRLAAKVSALTPAELAEYKSRVTAKTTDWNVYEAAIDRFIAERKEREATAKERRTLETRLYGLDELYRRYRAYLSLQSTAATQAAMEAAAAQSGQSSPVGGSSLGTQIALGQIRADLDADLVRAGLPGGIADLEALIRDYEKVFERETLATAKVMLDQYEHLLWTQEQRYQDPAEADALYQAVSGTRARAEYEAAEQIRSEHATTIVLSPDEMADQAYWVGQRNAALARGEANVRSAAAAHPLVANPDFDRERLARAERSEVRPLLLAYIATRKKDIADTRGSLAARPTMIYGLDKLLTASFQAQNIQRGSLYDTIIRDHISDVHWEEAIPQIVLAVVALAAGLLTGGGGALAVLAAGTTLGIGAYQALEEFRRYERKSAAYGAQLASDDPSLAWVIVAVIGAGIDAAIFASALPKLRPALAAFNAGAEAGDVAALSAKLDKLTDVEEGLRRSILRAAEAEVEARAAWKAVFRPPAALRALLVPGAEEFGRFVYAVYLSVRRGIREFQVFVKTNEAVSLIGDVAKLSAEDLAALKTGYLKAVEELETVAAHGKALGMADEEIDAFMRLRGSAKGMTAEQVITEMDTWNAAGRGALPAAAEAAAAAPARSSLAAILGQTEYTALQTAAEAAKAAHPELAALTTDEIIAIRAYSGESWSYLNQALRLKDPKELTRLGEFIDLMKSGLAKLPVYKGKVTRTIALTVPEAAEKYKVGATVVEDAFTSTTFGKPVAQREGNVFLTLQSSTGRDITQVAVHAESEILFPPGAKFVVTDVKQFGNAFLVEATEVVP